ncbi:MAG: substrate-binding domain-containing protein [Candidatus Izemoplasmatales bacterium]|jgi:phosphate transport system substrate-binding protein|nr:substrate-binding domain-containing protein [Candidatus Izemoplasmatales bacterium]
MKKILVTFSLIFVMLGVVACSNDTTTTTATTTTTSTAASFDQTKNITVYTRDTTSGTREAFFKGIGFDEATGDNTVLVSSYVEVDGNGSMITSVTNDVFGIGYISLASLSDTTLIGLNFEGVVASKANVLNGTYGLQRPFNYMVRLDWTGMETEHQIVNAFVAYMSTVDGKATISNKHGILETSTTDKLWDEIKSNYEVCSLDNSAVTINFGGSTSVESIAKALSAEFSTKCGNFIAEHNHTGSGDAYLRVQGTESMGANKLHIGFASRDFKSSEAAAEGTTGRICLDAVVVVVNANNPLLSNLTASDLKKIFGGETTIWSQLG